MSYLSGTFLGYDTFTSSPPIPYIGGYSNIKLLGGRTIVDKLKIENIDIPLSDLLAINITDKLTWNPNTILLAEFENTLDGGNILNLPTSLTGWDIYRTEVGTNISKYLVSVSADTIEYIDYSISSNRTYYYEIFPTTSTTIGVPITTANAATSFYGYYLMDKDNTNGIVYKFDLNVTSSDYEIVEDFVEYQSYNQYNSYAIGDRKFYKTSISAIAGTINNNGQLLQSVDYLETLKDFIQNGKIKYFKDRKGKILSGLTHGYKEKILNDAIGEQIYLVNFDFIQTEDI